MSTEQAQEDGREHGQEGDGEVLWLRHGQQQLGRGCQEGGVQIFARHIQAGQAQDNLEGTGEEGSKVRQMGDHLPG